MMDKVQRISGILIIIGIINVANAFLAGCIQAEKSYHTVHFTNTHWITMAILFAGIATAICPSFTSPSTSFIFTIVVDIFALAVCSATVIADFFNIIAIYNDFNALTTNTFITKVYGLLSYSTVDMLLSGISIVLILMMLSLCQRSLLDIPIEERSIQLTIIGYALIATSILKFFSWIIELYILRSFGNLIRFTFINYTTDEPIWIMLNILLGILCTLRVSVNSQARMITLCLSSISIYPTVTYLWIDYRWFSNAVISGIALTKWMPNWISVLNLSTGIMHVLLLIILTLSLTNLFEKPRCMNFSSQFRTFLFISGIITGIVSVILFAFDIIPIRLEAFYKIFHGNEQKTPFLTTLTSAFLFFASAKDVNFFIIPALLTTLLFCIQSTTFLLISYLYLSWNGYYANEVCEVFYRGSAWCTNNFTISSAITHFIETLLYYCVCVMSCTLTYIIWRVVQINPCHSTNNFNGKSITIIKLEKLIEKIGLALLIAGSSVLIATINEFLWNGSRHPQIVLLSSLYHISLTVTLLIFPIYQIFISRGLYPNLLHCTCLLMMSAIRFIDILTQLDYRNTGEVASWSWRIHNTAEVFALGAHFATTVLCLRILDMPKNARIFHMPEQFFEEFRNPLSRNQMDVQQQIYSFHDM